MRAIQIPAGSAQLKTEPPPTLLCPKCYIIISQKLKQLDIFQQNDIKAQE